MTGSNDIHAGATRHHDKGATRHHDKFIDAIAPVVAAAP